ESAEGVIGQFSVLGSCVVNLPNASQRIVCVGGVIAGWILNVSYLIGIVVLVDQRFGKFRTGRGDTQRLLDYSVQAVVQIAICRSASTYRSQVVVRVVEVGRYKCCVNKTSNVRHLWSRTDICRGHVSTLKGANLRRRPLGPVWCLVHEVRESLPRPGWASEFLVGPHALGCRAICLTNKVRNLTTG